ncbi:hypothetical protein CD29_05980 [Ureibacillus manganicus DSM 26584]|uniref:Tfp assembly type protein n=2 Tax=Ureibacillus TaxID=160795 RepID=A0A0A3I4I6_9BACL|nr:hypothetical protein CD29_05980 [Ureibacillus manganicus DSM 26584]
MRKFVKELLNKRLNNEKGLTLIELLAVIVILGIIAAIAVPAIGGIIDSSRIKAVKADAVNVINAANIYFTENQDAQNATGTQLSTYLTSFGNLDQSTVTVKKNASGGNSITATGTAGTTTIYFNDATLTEIDVDSATIGNTNATPVSTVKAGS